MRLLLALIDWLSGRRWKRAEQETVHYSADDPWVLRQIEAFERELKH
ncbi:hypothetical protein PH547_19800 [Rhizobium sp. CNPSo 3464]|nr:hypothetical protein [Rhizobium sp. CNPSo 3464]